MPRKYNTKDKKTGLTSTQESFLNKIGLDIQNIPEELKNEQVLDSSFLSYSGKNYCVYKVVPVSKIDIYLSDADRTTDIKERIKKAAGLGAYLNNKSDNYENGIETLIDLIDKTDIEQVNKIEKDQKAFQKEIPYFVKYEENYLWQIFYNQKEDKYFMLLPIKEGNSSAFWYLLKKKIEYIKDKKESYIYVPILKEDYSQQILKSSKIADVENYLWLFTKTFPDVYEVWEKEGKPKIIICGKTPIVDKIESLYKIELKDEKIAEEFYTFLKALFILKTETKKEYEFTTKVDKNANLIFVKDENEVSINKFSQFINKQIEKTYRQILDNEKKIQELERNLEDLKAKVKKQTLEYQARQRQIVLFLQCKKSFFKKISYFLKSKKKNTLIAKKEEKEECKQRKEENIKKSSPYEKNKNYTISDLVRLCKEKEEGVRKANLVNEDLRALKLKNINLEKKIKNATQYIEEIEEHQKSIFAFWKFANKDELPGLNEADEKIEDESKSKITKDLDYEDDIEDLGIKEDEVQRRKLSIDEINSIFVANYLKSTIKILSKYQKQTGSLDIRRIKKSEQEEIIQEYEKYIPDKYENGKDLSNLLGGFSSDYQKIRTLNNKKHREIPKDIISFLAIDPKEDFKAYVEKMLQIIRYINEASHKIKSSCNMIGYMISDKIDEQGYNFFTLDYEEAVNKLKNLKDKENLYIYRIKILEESPVLFNTNIIFFSNENKTLPLGMDVSKEILVNLNAFEKVKKQDDVYIILKESDEKIDSIKVAVLDYISVSTTK